LRISRPVRDLFRPYYYRLKYLTSRGVGTMKVGGVTARFYVSSRRELMRISGMTGEKAVLARFLGELRPGDIVFDIGANIGTHTVAFAKVVGEEGRVASFEPEPITAGRLERNIELNGLNNVTLMRCALGERESIEMLYVDSRSGSGQHSLCPQEGRSAEEVRVLQGDELVRSGQLSSPNVMKIDVEGAELGVIAGLEESLANESCRLVFCEVHNAILEKGGQDPKGIDRMLREAGFTEFEKTSRGPEDHLIARKAGRPGGKK
jgi:FkbM family methyltransferase